VKIHFIGIGGIGISGLAKFLLSQGHEISGSDIMPSVITDALVAQGIRVTIPHHASAINNQDLVIHSAIISQENIEIQEAMRKNITVKSRKEALSFILKEYEVFSVCGAHGKSTTSAILAAILEGSVIIGAETKAFKDNVRIETRNNRLIFEADESDSSFLNSNPYCAVVTNAEPEHMEHYDYDLDRFHQAYRTFLQSASYRVVNAEDAFLASLDLPMQRLYPSSDIKNISYVLVNDEPHTRFELKDLGVFEVWGIGEHIALDASLAILAAMYVLPIDEIKVNILRFKGIKKRFDIINSSQTVLIDDYGHHPTEIRATLKSVKEYAKLKGFDKITAIWQPHKYSRTIDNLEEFISCFDDAQELIILPVYSAGERERQIDFAKKFNRHNPTFADTIVRDTDGLEVMKNDRVLKRLDKGLIIGFGAGDITYQLRGDL